MQTASKKVVNGWAMYDWANSVYNLVITSTIFPAYYEAMANSRKDGDTTYVTFLGREFVNTSLYNYIIAFALTIVAVAMPLLTSIADYRGTKKKFLGFFLTLGSLGCMSLFLFKDIDTLKYAAIGMTVACICYWSSLVFYNSYLPEIAAPEDRDRVSAKGFSYGYIGSVILQIICFVFVLGHDMFGITTGMGSRLSFILVGIWWLGFGLFALKRLPAPKAAGDIAHPKNIFTEGYEELGKVWQQLKKLPTLKSFLFAFFFFNMGVQTVMLAAALYGKSELAIPQDKLIGAILLIQLVAIPGAYFISKLSNKLGNIKAMMIVVAAWIFLCIVAYIAPKGNVTVFYCLGACVGFVMGGVQSLSRSTYAKLMPETNDTASFFSFYDVTEKVAVVIGMIGYGYLTELSGSQRNSVLALSILFIIGTILLWRTLRIQNKQS